MYRIAKINALPLANFAANDKAVIADDEKAYMSETAVDKTHQSSAYLNSAVDAVNSSINRLQQFASDVENKYFTSTIANTYVTADTLVHASHVADIQAIGAAGGLMTKADAAAKKAECISEIKRLKERVMNMFTANLNSVFMQQQTLNQSTYNAKASASLTNADQYYAGNTPASNNFNLTSGKFSLKYFMTGYNTVQSPVDFWTTYYAGGSFDFSTLSSVSAVSAAVNAENDNSTYGMFNADGSDTNLVIVPDVWLDTTHAKTMPVGTAIFEVLKQEIYTVIKNTYMYYMVKMLRTPSATT